jgi:hypothetical protein
MSRDSQAAGRLNFVVIAAFVMSVNAIPTPLKEQTSPIKAALNAHQPQVSKMLGKKGRKGRKGRTGEEGPPGDRGELNAKGDKGPRGPKGDRGRPGFDEIGGPDVPVVIAAVFELMYECVTEEREVYSWEQHLCHVTSAPTNDRCRNPCYPPESHQMVDGIILYDQLDDCVNKLEGQITNLLGNDDPRLRIGPWAGIPHDESAPNFDDWNNATTTPSKFVRANIFKGPRGDRGDKGPPGDKGDTGDPGAPGKGQTGAQGSKGVGGDAGAGSPYTTVEDVAMIVADKFKKAVRETKKSSSQERHSSDF